MASLEDFKAIAKKINTMQDNEINVSIEETEKDLLMDVFNSNFCSVAIDNKCINYVKWNKSFGEYLLKNLEGSIQILENEKIDGSLNMDFLNNEETEKE